VQGFGGRKASRRVLVASGDPPDSDQARFAGTVHLVQVCKEHDPDPRQSMPLPRPTNSMPPDFRAPVVGGVLEHRGEGTASSAIRSQDAAGDRRATV